MKRIVLALLFLGLGSAVSAQDLNTMRGNVAFLPTQVSDIDRINISNGNVSVQVPLSIAYPVQPHFNYQFFLSYNSKGWDIEYGYYGPHGELQRLGVPEKTSNAGFGWRVSLGNLYPASSIPNNPSLRWRYVAPDGTERHFSKTTGAMMDPETAETEDGSFLKLVRTPATGTVQYREVFFPDGMIHKFDSQNRLTEVRDRYGNWVRVAYAGLLWTITNGDAGSATPVRTHTINFATRSNTQPNFQQVVSSVNLASWGSQTQTYTFAYHDTAIPRGGCSDEPVHSSYQYVTVPFLDSVTGPDGISWQFTYGETGGGCSSGALTSVSLPTKGKIEYAYTPWEMSTEACIPANGYWATFGGLWKKTVRDASGQELERTTYAPVLTKGSMATLACGGANYFVNRPADEARVDVTHLDGTKTTHYFAAFRAAGTWTGYSNLKKEYGLPLTRTAQAPGTSGTRFLSTRAYDESGGTLKVSTYLEYEMDVATGDQQVNPRLKSNRTVHDADSSHYTDETRTSWDSYGHYRQKETTTSIPNSDFQKITTFRNHTPDGTNRLLEIFDYETTTLQKIDGSVTASRTDTCFPAGSAFPTRIRVRKDTSSSTPTSAQDQIVVYTRNSLGQITEEQAHGGDGNAVSTGTQLCTLNGLTRNATTSTIRHTYSNGALATSRYWTQDATPVAMPFKVADRTIDARTGLVTTSRDTAGVATNFEYDRHGRILWIKPAPGDGAWTQFTYTAATGPSAPAKVTVVDRPNGSTTGTLTTHEVQFDALGRTSVEKDSQPGGTWAYRTTDYDSRGRVRSVSELESSSSPTRMTTYDYDWAGRVLKIHPPDHNDGGSHFHDVTFAWTGARQRTKTAKMASTPTSETDATITEKYDGLGRLRTLEEKSGSGGTDVTTTYSYDVGGRLAKVSIAAPELGTPQVRLFNYDGRGVLASEQHPELGASGNGTRSHKYDASGRSLESWYDASLFHIKTTYDAAGRPVEVYDVGASTVLKTFTYGTTGYGLGRLTQATRYHTGSAAGWKIVEDFTYNSAGRPVSRTTKLYEPNGVTPAKTWTSPVAWDSEGVRDSLEYPHLGSARRTLDLAYTEGRLAAIDQITGANVSYWPGGMPNLIPRINGVTDELIIDPANQMNRPKEIRFLSVSSPQDAIVWRHSGTGENAVWLLNGLSLHLGTTLPNASLAFEIRGFEDLDGDGTRDVFWRNKSTGENTVWILDNGQIETGLYLPSVSGSNFTIAAVGDLNGDGRADIVWRNQTNGDVPVWIMNNSVISASAVVATVSDLNMIIRGVGDINGDGRSDILWRNQVTGDNAVWLMNGTTLIQGLSLPAVTDLGMTMAGIGDFDGDGKSGDIFWHKPSTGETAIWLMNGATIAASGTLSSTTSGWAVGAIADIDGDGHDDVVWRNSSTGENAAWMMNGLVLKSSGFLPIVSDTGMKIAGPRGGE